MMHQAAYKYCKPEASIKFDTYHVDGRTIVVATVPPSDRNEAGEERAYIRIADENIVASPVHLAIWRDQQAENGAMMTYTDTVKKLLSSMASDRPDTQPQPFTLNQIVRRSRISRFKVIHLLARLIRFGIVRCEHRDQQFFFSMLQ